MYFSQFWRLGVWNQGVSVLGFWWEPPSCLQAANFSLCSHMAEREEANAFVILKRALNPVMRSAPSRIQLILTTSQRSHLLKPLQWGIGFQHVDLGGGAHINIPSIRIVKINVYKNLVHYFLPDINFQWW